MSVAAAIRQVLLTFAPLTALVESRVYVMLLPQNPTLPAVRVQRIDEDEPIHFRGPGNLRRARIQVDSIGGGGAVAETVDAAVHGDGISTGLRAYQGTVGTIRIELMDPADVRTVYDADELRQYKVARDYFAWYRDVM